MEVMLHGNILLSRNLEFTGFVVSTFSFQLNSRVLITADVLADASDVFFNIGQKRIERK